MLWENKTRTTSLDTCAKINSLWCLLFTGTYTTYHSHQLLCMYKVHTDLYMRISTGFCSVSCHTHNNFIAYSWLLRTGILPYMSSMYALRCTYWNFNTALSSITYCSYISLIPRVTNCNSHVLNNSGLWIVMLPRFGVPPWQFFNCGMPAHVQLCNSAICSLQTTPIFFPVYYSVTLT